MIRAFVLALLAAASSGAAAIAQDNQFHPLTFTTHGHATTPVVINGMGPFAFIVDTAASAATVTSALTSELGLLPEPGKARVQGGGGVESADFYMLSSLVVAGVESRARPAAMLDRVQIDYSAYGVIGSDVLSKGVLALDLPNGRMSFGKPGDIGDARGPGWVSVPIKLNDLDFALVPMEIEGKRVTAVLDTGARRSVVNWAWAKKLRLTPRSSRVAATDDIEGATAQSTKAHAVEAASIKAGDLEWQSRALTIADLSVFEALGLEDKPAMILGLDLLKELRVVVDYGGQRLYLQRP
jgi:predicted aspartyl protease